MSSRAALLRVIMATWPLILEQAASKGAKHAARATLPKRIVLMSPPEGQTKLVKASKVTGGRWLNYGLALSPWHESGHNLCRWEAGCGPSCLRECGQYAMDPAKQARLWRTALMLGSPELFRALLRSELEALQRKAERERVFIGIRLNLLSDLPELAGELASWARSAQLGRLAWYDYTKSALWARRSVGLAGAQLDRVWRVLSYTSGPRGVSWRSCEKLLKAGGSVAVVFAGEIPARWGEDGGEDFPVLPGDDHDLRHPGEGGHVIGLTLKGGPRVARVAQALAVVS